jgi:hypothetical protein
LIIELNDLLATQNRQFGYRVANEIARFVLLASQQSDGDAQTFWAALDLAVLQKILPKFHGTQQELERPLKALLAFAVAGKRPLADAPASDGDEGESETEALPRTATKLRKMQTRLRDQGFTSFIE